MNKKLRAPIWWFGGKGRMIGKIVPILESIPHEKYVEVFGGAASILIAKSIVPLEVYNDIDAILVEFFKVLSDEKLFERFYRKVAVLPYSRGLWKEYNDSWSKYEDIVERVSRWFLVARQSFSGVVGNSWSFSVSGKRSGMSKHVSSWLSCLEMLPEIHHRLSRVQIENQDFRRILECYDDENTLFYLDPPYVHSTRKSSRYKFEILDTDHEALVEMLLNLKGSWVLSGYQNSIYKPLEKVITNFYEFEISCSAVGRTRGSNCLGPGSATKNHKRVECLWVCNKYLLV